MQVHDFTTDLDLSTDELLALLDLAASVKKTPTRYRNQKSLLQTPPLRRRQLRS